MRRVAPFLGIFLATLCSCTQNNADYFQTIAKQLNQKLPKQVDGTVTQDKVEYDVATNTLSFWYTVQKSSGQIEKEYSGAGMSAQIRKMANMNKDDVLTRNVNYSFHYKSAVDGEVVNLKYSNQELRQLLSQ